MKGAPEVRNGTRVRVVLEGVATNSRFSRFAIGEWNSHVNYIDPDADHVVSVEILPDPPKVGDQVTVEVLDQLPVGSVVRAEGGLHVIKSAEWISNGYVWRPNGHTTAPVPPHKIVGWSSRVVYIPADQ